MQCAVLISVVLGLGLATAAGSCYRALQANAALFSAIPFDYIIVGAGPAGLTLASRLTENPNVTVGVIEAGVYHQYDPLIDIPENFGQALGNPMFDWGFLTTPQSGTYDSEILLSRRMIGGSTGINFMAWTRASSIEYDTLEQLGNGPAWNWTGLLPYFKKTETYNPPYGSAVFPNSAPQTSEDMLLFHGESGPIDTSLTTVSQISYNTYYSNITYPFVETVNNLGVVTNPDPNDGNSTGVFNLPYTVNRALGVRSYAANSYFSLSACRTNLHILTSAQATKVLFDNGTDAVGNLVATGVQFAFGRDTLTANASKEVILSAGSLQSPQLLELSGIGNSTILSNLGIPVVLDLPEVGENLQDQGVVPRDFLLNPGTLAFDELRNNFTFALQQLAEYENMHDGIYAATIPAAVLVPISYIVSNETLQEMKANVTMQADQDGVTPLYKAQLDIQMQWLSNENIPFLELLMFPGGGMTSTPPNQGSSYMTIYTVFLHPFSRGSTHITSANPLTPPTINPNYLTHAIDSAVMAGGGRLGDMIAGTPPLSQFVSGPSTPPAGSDFLNYTKTYLQSIFHPIGTAALASRDLGGVVDPSLKVYGTTNLRVVDASVIPMELGTHIQATVYAIAEKAADMIKEAALQAD
ncbi:GMC oxidoreductase [Heliocybe sulcata]|uniref:GMC oxidoreductase n=1 Tax=Heliocybe sulcata TaxID=5364 RepID=A0A5C3N9D5_9AGAM|nr:GMC oxidoreductase [Heliocybe sulcata]